MILGRLHTNNAMTTSSTCSRLRSLGAILVHQQVLVCRPKSRRSRFNPRYFDVYFLECGAASAQPQSEVASHSGRWHREPVFHLDPLATARSQDRRLIPTTNLLVFS